MNFAITTRQHIKQQQQQHQHNNNNNRLADGDKLPTNTTSNRISILQGLQIRIPMHVCVFVHTLAYSNKQTDGRMEDFLWCLYFGYVPPSSHKRQFYDVWGSSVLKRLTTELYHLGSIPDPVIFEGCFIFNFYLRVRRTSTFSHSGSVSHETSLIDSHTD